MAPSEVLLTLEGVSVAYGHINALREVSLEVRRGEIVVLIGANGAGKTTLLETALGINTPLSGRILFKGRPIGWQLPIRDVMVYKGAEFVVPMAGEIKLMPGTGSNPAFRRIDVDVNTGKVQGLF